MIHRYFGHILLFCLITLIPVPAHASIFGNSEYASLAELADAIAKEMKESHAGKSLYLDREDIRDSADGSVYPFSAKLANELERALSKSGFGFESRGIERADLVLAVSFQKTAEVVQVYLKLKNLKQDYAYRALKGNYELPLAKLPSDSFSESLDAKVDKLAVKVAGCWQRVTPMKLYVYPIVDSRLKISSPFAENLTNKLKDRLGNSPMCKLFEEKPVLKKTAATRSVTEAHAGIDAGNFVATGADTLLEGTYQPGGRSVNVAIKVKRIADGEVKIFNENIPVELIKDSLKNEDGETLATLADTENEQSGGMVGITTTKGAAYQIYHDGEVVQFSIRTGKRLYLYVYDINPKGEATLLFPKIGETESPRRPGINHLIPDDKDPWEIRVESPYGTDAVKVFACEKRLPLPHISGQAASKSFSGGTRALKRVEVQAELAVQAVINARDLVDYYKGVSSRMGVLLYESTVYVETRGK